MSKAKEGFLINLSPFWRTVISLIVAAAILVPLYLNGENLLFDLICAWLGFALSFLFLSWYIILQRGVEQIRKKANEDDGSVIFVFVVIIISSFASMFAVLLLIISKDQSLPESTLVIPAAVLSMITAWFLVHTQYVFHYAHEYYDVENNGGLDFPDDKNPDYLDFAYYSLCMGCTFQVSDVDVTSKKLRRITMIHGLLAFFMNTFVVALTINMVAGLNQN